MISLRPLAPGNEAHAAALQLVLEGAPAYARAISENGVAPDAGRGVLTASPPNLSSARKHTFLLERAGTPVGCLDMLRGFPVPDRAMLGLLLLREEAQGRGLGRTAFALAEALARSWEEVRWLRIGVVETNLRVLPFWSAMGLVDTGGRRPYENEGVRSVTRLLEKQIR